MSWKETIIRDKAIRKRYDELLKLYPDKKHKELHLILSEEYPLKPGTINTICNKI